MADLFLLGKLLANHQKSNEPSFYKVMDSFVLLAYTKFGRFKNPFAMITSLSELHYRFWRFILLGETKKVISINYGSSTQAAESHGDEWHLTWYLQWGIYTSIPTWTHSQNLLAVAEAPSLKISFHGTSLNWSQRPSQSAQGYS